MKRGGGWLAYGLLGWMLVGGSYEIWVDQAWLGGGIWVLTALLLLPLVQDWIYHLSGWQIPPPLSLGVFVLGFVTGLLLI